MTASARPVLIFVRTIGVVAANHNRTEEVK